MQNIILTIGIPVYNGGQDLQRLLESIVIQDFERSSVQILVSDNCSQDNSLQIAKRFECDILSSDLNKGADLNILKTITQAKGKFVWIVGHDDILIDGSIKRVHGLIEKNSNLSSIFVDYSLMVNQKILREKFTKIREEIILKDKDAIIKNLGIAPNFISSLVHNRSKFLTSSPEKFIGSHWLQIATWLNYADSGMVVAIGVPQVINSGNSEGRDANKSDISLTVLGNLYSFYNDFYSNDSQKLIIDKYIGESLIRKIFNIRKKGLIIDRSKIEWINSMKMGVNMKLKLFILLNVPNISIALFNRFYLSNRMLRKLLWARI